MHDEKSVAHHTVNLLTSTIKVDADQSDLRFCFRIISPTKNYTLQVRFSVAVPCELGFNFMLWRICDGYLYIGVPAMIFIYACQCRQRVHLIKWIGLRR